MEQSNMQSSPTKRNFSARTVSQESAGMPHRKAPKVGGLKLAQVMILVLSRSDGFWAEDFDKEAKLLTTYIEPGSRHESQLGVGDIDAEAMAKDLSHRARLINPNAAGKELLCTIYPHGLDPNGEISHVSVPAGTTEQMVDVIKSMLEAPSTGSMPYMVFFLGYPSPGYKNGANETDNDLFRSPVTITPGRGTASNPVSVGSSSGSSRTERSKPQGSHNKSPSKKPGDRARLSTIPKQRGKPRATDDSPSSRTTPLDESPASTASLDCSPSRSSCEAPDAIEVDEVAVPIGPEEDFLQSLLRDPPTPPQEGEVNADDVRWHDQVCKFFCYKWSKYRRNVHVIPGMNPKAPMRDYQLYAIWYTLVLWYVGVPNPDSKADPARYQLSGVILGMDVGLGKTPTTLGIYHVRDLILGAWLDLLVRPTNPLRSLLQTRRTQPGPATGHNALDAPVGQACPSGNPLGIQCPCVRGSLSRAVAEAVFQNAAPSLFLAPTTTIIGFLVTFAKFFGEEALGNDWHDKADGGYGSRLSLRLYCPAIETQSHEILPKVKRLTARDIKDMLLAYPRRGTAIINATNQPGSLNILDESIPSTGASSTGSKVRGKDLGRYILECPGGNSKRAAVGTVILVSSNPGTVDGLLKTFGLDISLPERGKRGLKKTAQVTIPNAIPWSTITIDEFQHSRGSETKTMQLLQRALRHVPEGLVKTNLVSGTPYSTSLRASLLGPARAVLPSAWDVEGHAMHPYSYHVLSTVLIPRVEKAVSKASKHGSKGEPGADPNEYMERLRKLSNLFMIRMRADDTFLGAVLLPKPPMDIYMIAVTDPSSIELNSLFERSRSGWKASDLQRDGKEGSAAYAAASRLSSFTTHIFAATLPGVARLSRLGLDPVQFVNDNMLADKVPYLGSREARANSPLAPYVNVLLRADDAKMAKVFEILNAAAEDDSPVETFEGVHVKEEDECLIGQVLKKHVVILCTKAAMANVLAVFFDNLDSCKYDIECITAKTPTQRREGICQSTVGRRILYNSPEKPTLLIATTDSIGTGLNSLVSSNYVIILNPPFREDDVVQGLGRLHRQGQVQRVHAFVMVSGNTDLEHIFLGRHVIRMKVFRSLTDKNAVPSCVGMRYGGRWHEVSGGDWRNPSNWNTPVLVKPSENEEVMAQADQVQGRLESISEVDNAGEDVFALSESLWEEDEPGVI
jgi:hypothetical protein